MAREPEASVVELRTQLLELPEARAGAELAVLCQRLQFRMNAVLEDKQVKAILLRLQAEGHFELSGGGLWRRCEKDQPEEYLYGPLLSHLQAPDMLSALGVTGSRYVISDTSRGGARSGRFSRPDLTLATIRSWRFDPQATLEVFSFEVKNRRGSDVAAVYEAVAHGRMAHHTYLVCPRTNIFREQNDLLRRACAREGVGLILFDLLSNAPGAAFTIEGLSLEIIAERRAPNPAEVEQYLSERLAEEQQQALAAAAREALRGTIIG